METLSIVKYKTHLVAGETQDNEVLVLVLVVELLETYNDVTKTERQ